MNEPEAPPDTNRKFEEGVHFYFENDLMVLTERFLLERGYCCGNGCRHCPYENDLQRRNSSSSLCDGT
ncbi:DUF5522 domain-containing protein [Leptolyngbya sp. 7M]|uniref:DUF5522 domain-containing protein n=1 Tax=Leptolyngbya sp. 7M TaxID=2812896 RepID=UPI001B8B818E|nr:hypothetical protein JVX88_01895 [Leptolyngbya sp. 7M]